MIDLAAGDTTVGSTQYLRLNRVRRPAARSFSEEGEILAQSLVRILTGPTSGSVVCFLQ